MGKFRISLYNLNFPTPFSVEFPHSQDNRAGISKKFLSFSTLFLYVPWNKKCQIKMVNTKVQYNVVKKEFALLACLNVLTRLHNSMSWQFWENFSRMLESPN